MKKDTGTEPRQSSKLGFIKQSLKNPVPPKRKPESRFVLLKDTCKKIIDNHDLATFVNDLADNLYKIIACSAARILLYTERDGRVIAATRGFISVDQDDDGKFTPDQVNRLCTLAFNEEQHTPTDFSTRIFSLSEKTAKNRSPSQKELAQIMCQPYGFKSLVLVPVKSEDWIIGFIQLADQKGEGIISDEVEMAEAVAYQMQLAVELRKAKESGSRITDDYDRRLYERDAQIDTLKQRLAKEVADMKQMQGALRIQRDLAIALAESEDLETALTVSLEVMLKISVMDIGSIYRIDADTGTLKLVTSVGYTKEMSKQTDSYTMPAQFLKIVTRGKPIYVNRQALKLQNDKLTEFKKLKALGIIAIKNKRKVFAFLHIASNDLEEVPLDKRNLLETVAAQIGATLQKIEDRDAIKENLERYLTVFEKSPNPILVIDDDGNYVECNQSALKFMECSREMLLSMNVKDTLPPYLDDDWFKKYKAMWKKSVVTERDYLINGKIKTLEISMTPSQLGGKKVIFGVARDITEQRRVMKALEESEKKYRAVVENAAEGMVIIQAGKIKFINQQMEEYLGYKAEEVCGQFVVDFLHPDEQHKFTEHNQGSMKAERSIKLFTVYRIRTRSGKYKWVEIRGTILQWEREPAILVMAIDVDDRVKAQEALVKSEERYRLLAENSMDCICTFDFRGNPTYISPAIRHQLGVTEDEVMSLIRDKKKYADTFGLEKSAFDEFIKAFKNIFRGSKAEEVLQYRTTRRDGSKIWLEMKISGLRDQTGTLKGFLGIGREITKQKKLIERLIMTDRLRSLGEMSAGLAHEVSNPLTAVNKFSTLLMQNSTLPADVVRDIAAINHEGARASEIIKNFRIFARGNKPAKQVIFINDIVEFVLRLRHDHLAKLNIRLILKLGRELPAIKGDVTLLQQAILNIIVNAEYYMSSVHQGGVLTIETYTENKAIYILIEDDGPGIPEGYIDHIFDPFFTTKAVGEGTGLGLSITYGIIREHGGSIYAESKEGSGAVFIIELPVDR